MAPISEQQRNEHLAAIDRFKAAVQYDLPVPKTLAVEIQQIVFEHEELERP